MVDEAFHRGFELGYEKGKESAYDWHFVKYRLMTKEECEDYEGAVFGEAWMYECELPDDGQEVLIYDKYGFIEKTTFYTDCGCYFENYEDEDDVIAWMKLPDPPGREKNKESK